MSVADVRKKNKDKLKQPLWKLGFAGRPPVVKTAAELAEHVQGYFDWLEANPLWEEKLFSYQGEVTRDRISKMRAATIDGLCLYIGICYQTWSNYRRNPKFIEVITNAEKAIREQKFSGAAAELLNPNIIARDLGLHDNAPKDDTGDYNSDDEFL